MSIKFKRLPHCVKNFEFKYETSGSACVDLPASIDTPLTLKPMERAIVPTGFCLEMPANYVFQIYPRSGMAAKKAITTLTAPGIVDSDYRGEVGVALINLSSEDYTINRGDRIAQASFVKVEQIIPEETTDLSKTDRGAGGFGSTGV